MNSEIQNAVTAALNELNLGSGQKQFEELRAGICENGFDVDVLRAVVRQIKANKRDWDVIKVSDIVRGYESRLMTSERVKTHCDYCHGSGWLKPVLIEGMHNNYMKTYIVNFYQPEKYFKFVKTNTSFRAFAGLLPCSCENGDRNNHRFSETWLSEEQRNKATAYSVKYQGEAGKDAEDYYQGELIRCLNLAAEGKEYKSRRLKDYPQDIEELKIMLSESLGQVQNKGV